MTSEQTSPSSKSEEIDYLLYEPYATEYPQIPRMRPDLSRPSTREEKMYCWRYWIELILDPTHTRHILDELDNYPVYVAPWGDRIDKKGYDNCIRRQRKVNSKNRTHNIVYTAKARK